MFPHFYLHESNPRNFIVTLHGVPEVVLQSPEFSVQVVVDGDGTGSKKVTLSNGQKKRTNFLLELTKGQGHLPLPSLPPPPPFHPPSLLGATATKPQIKHLQSTSQFQIKLDLTDLLAKTALLLILVENCDIVQVKLALQIKTWKKQKCQFM